MKLATYIEKYSPEGNLISHLFAYLAKQHPTDEFIFITTKGNNKINESNVKTLAIAPKTSNWFIRKWWLTIQLPLILKRHQADIFICKEFSSALSIPQCLIIEDFANQKHLPIHFQKARSVVCFSNHDKNEILKIKNSNPPTIKLVPPAIDEIFKSFNEADKKMVKENLAGGHEYFFYNGELNFNQGTIDLLKAFSIFKKMQQSNMKLVLASHAGNNYKKLIENLKTYKYRDDVIIKYPVSQNELVFLLASSYALLLPSIERTGIKFLEAAQVRTPVISTGDIKEIARDAALYFNSGDYSDLAKQMMYLYKDEDLRKELIRKDSEIAGQYSISNSAKLLWEAIEDALK